MILDLLLDFSFKGLFFALLATLLVILIINRNHCIPGVLNINSWIQSLFRRNNKDEKLYFKDRTGRTLDIKNVIYPYSCAIERIPLSECFKQGNVPFGCKDTVIHKGIPPTLFSAFLYQTFYEIKNFENPLSKLLFDCSDKRKGPEAHEMLSNLCKQAKSILLATTSLEELSLKDLEPLEILVYEISERGLADGTINIERGIASIQNKKLSFRFRKDASNNKNLREMCYGLSYALSINISIYEYKMAKAKAFTTEQSIYCISVDNPLKSVSFFVVGNSIYPLRFE